MSKRVLDLAGLTLDDIHIEIEIPLDQLTPEYVAERSHSIIATGIGRYGQLPLGSLRPNIGAVTLEPPG